MDREYKFKKVWDQLGPLISYPISPENMKQICYGVYVKGASDGMEWATRQLGVITKKIDDVSSKIGK